MMNRYELAKKLKIFTLQYELTKDARDGGNIFIVRILSDSYESAEYELRKQILNQLAMRGIQANIDSCLTVTNRHISSNIDLFTSSVLNLLRDKVDL